MKIKILSILPFLFFSLNFVSAKELKEIKVPSFMDGVKKDPSQQDVYYSYDGGVVVNKTVNELKKGGIEGFVKKLFLTYQSKDEKAFKTLFTEKALAQMESLGKSVIEKEWKTLTAAKNAYLRSYFNYKGGVVVSWKVGGVPRGLYLIKQGESYKIDSFSAESEDASFHNRSLFFTYLPNKELPAKVLKSFSLSDSVYQLVIKTSKERPLLHILKKEKGVWKTKVLLKDNSVGKGRFDDLDPKDGVIKIKFSKTDFTQDIEHELLVLQSNFPLKRYPLEKAQSGNLFINP
tara:strand:- start:14917 stop:15786 length:870 start_codon:yes stop_codon:yes gene_type:complete